MFKLILFRTFNFLIDVFLHFLGSIHNMYNSISTVLVILVFLIKYSNSSSQIYYDSEKREYYQLRNETSGISIADNFKKDNNKTENSNPGYGYKIIKNTDHTFGYDITANGKLLIHQPNIPSLPGNKGFSTKRAATKSALLVISKLNKKIMPPTISRKEADSLALIK